MQTRSSGRRIWVWVLIGLLMVAGVAAYFAGAAVERSARTRDATAAEQKYAAHQAQLRDSQSQLASVKSTNALLTANVWAYRATVALDDRNFGLANDAVAEVVASLKGVDAAAATLDSAALNAVQVEASGIKISVATNLEEQRGRLLRLAADITALAGPKTNTQ